MTRTALLLAFLGALGMATASLPGTAQAQSDSRDLANRLDRLERDMTLVQRKLYNIDGTAPTPTGAQPSGAPLTSSGAAQMDIRIGDLENALQVLTGRVEELGHAVRQLDAKVERLGNQSPVAMPSAPGTAPLETPAPPSGVDNGGLARPAPPGADAGAGATELPTTIIGGQAPSTGGGKLLADGTAEEQFSQAFGYLRVGDHAKGEQALREFLELHPDDPASGNAYYWLGKIYFARGDFQQAAIAYAEGYQKFPDGPKAELTLLNLAQSLGKLGKKAQACASLEQLDTQFPNAGPTVRGEAKATREQLGCG